MSSETSVSSNRLDRVWRFLAISGLTWFAIGSYYVATGRTADSFLCLSESIVSFALIAFLRTVSRRVVVNVFLMAMTAGLMVETCLSGLSLSFTPSMFCVVVLMAAYLLGPRSAWVWAGISTSCLALIHFSTPDLLPKTSAPLLADRIIMQVGILFLTLAFSVMGERSAEAYASRLEAVSDKLRQKTQILNDLVGVDSLTSLQNRHQFNVEIEAALKQARSDRTSFSVLLVDLDGFKQINDRYGHAVGDEVLVEVASRLKSVVGRQGTVARLGGDEFTIIADQIALEGGVRELAENVVEYVSQDYAINGKMMKLGASAGSATYPQDGETSDDLLLNADAAMYEAKTNGIGVQVYAPWITEELRRKEEADKRLELAIRNNEFLLFYQPQVDLRTGQIVGVEALLRWDRDGQFVTPAEFIANLEDSGTIMEVGRWVLNEACHQARDWSRCGASIRVGVNVSSVQFQQPSFLDDVWKALENSGLAPDLLDLELTETVFLDQTADAILSIELLREAGISISIDDFGTGYSSLSYLKSLPINRLKIDRSFIKDIPGDDDGMIAATVIGLAHNLGMQVLAEGVDCDVQLDFLKEKNCDEYQGYYCSPPVSVEDTYKLLGISQDNAIHKPLAFPDEVASKLKTSRLALTTS